MAIRAKIQPITQDIKILIDGALSKEAINRRFQEFVAAEIERADETNRQAMGDVPDRTLTVNGRQGAPLSSATAPGVVIVDYALQNDIVKWLWAKIRELSPVRSGRFRDSMRLYADGAMVNSVEETTGAREILIIPTVAYARKLEGGKRPAISAQAPNGVMEVAANEAKGRFGNRVAVKFTYAEVFGGNTHLGAWAAGRAGTRAKDQGAAAARRSAAKDRRNPAISIRFR